MANRFSQNTGAPSFSDGATPRPNRFSQSGPISEQQPIDPRQQAAVRDVDAMEKGPTGYMPQFAQDLQHKIMQGATLGWGDEVRAAGLAAIHGIGSTKSFGEVYADEKALIDEQERRATERTGVYGTAAEIAGGLGTGAGLAARGLTAVHAGQGVGTRIGASALEGGGYGAVQGAGQANDGHRMDGAIEGGLSGAALGGAVPAAAAVVGPFARTAVSKISSLVDPQGYANSLIGQAVGRSGRTGRELAGEVSAAHAAGQNNYTLADALVNAREENLLRGMMTQPGQGASSAARFLDNRQGGQHARISRFSAEDFGAPRTAQQHETLLQDTRRRADDINYPAAAAGAGPVDIGPAISTINSIRYPGNARLGVQPTNPVSVAPAAVERAAEILSRARVDGNHYESILSAKQQIGDLIGEAVSGNRSNDARLLSQINEQLDAALEAATGGPRGLYRAANDTHLLYKQGVEAIDAGRSAYDTGSLAEDVVPAFNNASPIEQASQRVGFRDAIRSHLPRNRNVNAARQFLGSEMRDKTDAFALPGRAQQFADRMEREDIMSTTRNAATGGSPTARNHAAQDDAEIDPRVALEIVSAAHSGSPTGLLSALSGLWTHTRTPTQGHEAVRNEVLRQLMGAQNVGALPAPGGWQLPNAVRSLLGLPGATAPGDLRGLLEAIDRNNAGIAHVSSIARRTAAQGPALWVQQEREDRPRRPAGPFAQIFNNAMQPAPVRGGR